MGRISQKRLIKTYKAKAGNVSATCLACGISRKTFYEWMKKPKFFDAVEEIDEGFIDFAESSLKKNIKNGNQRAIEYYLDKKGKKRGYGQETNIKLSGEVKKEHTLNVEGLTEAELLLISKLEIEDDPAT